MLDECSVAKVSDQRISSTKIKIPDKQKLQGFHILLLPILYLLLNAVMTVYLWIPDYNFLMFLVPSVESLSLFVFLIVISFLKKEASRALSYLATFLLTIYILFAFGEAIMQFIFQREFIPWTDIGFISTGLQLLLGDISGEVNLLAGVVIVFLIAASFFTAYTLVRWTNNTISRVNLHPAAAIFGATSIFFILVFSRAPDPLLYKMLKQINPPDRDISFDVNEDNLTHQHGELKSFAFNRLKDRNVYLFFIESYGYTIYSRPELSYELIPFLRQVYDELDKAGYSVVSDFLVSPVSGGWSWLAEATFLTGRLIDNQHKYERLLKSDSKSLPKIFNKAGYFTLLSMPGTVYGDWPEGKSFYGFDEYLLSSDFHYNGPTFSFVPIPDQFAIYKTHNRLFDRGSGGGADKPIYAQYVLVSSHAPFNKIPAYIANWDDLDDGSIYKTSSNLFFANDWLSGKEYDKGYATAIRYVWKVVSNYLIRFVHDDSLIILVGDHQPKRPLREKAAPLSVPIHIVSRDPELISSFLRSGYTSGLIPDQPVPHKGMETFLPAFMEVIRGTTEPTEMFTE